MASLNSSSGIAGDANAEKQYYRYNMYFNPPLSISMSSKCTTSVGNTGRKYPKLLTYVEVSLVERGEAQTNRYGVSLSPDDWYRWMAVIAEMLAKTRTIYVDGHVSDDVTDQDFKITNFKGEVIQMVPLMAKVEDEMVPAVRIIVNDPSRFADFPLIDIKSMHSVLNKVDLFTASLCGAVLGEHL